MKLKVEKSKLLTGLQTVQNVVGIRTTLPILSNVLVNAEKTKVELTTTDLDLSVRCMLDCEASKTGATTLPVKRFLSIVRELPEGDLEIDMDDQNVATVECGSSFYKIIGLSADEFPPVAKGDGTYSYRIDQGVFKDMLKKTAYAASTDETRCMLNGVLLSFKGDKLTIIATDGRRLALAEHHVEFPKEAESDVILPTKAVAELLRVLADEGEMKLVSKEKQIIFDMKSIVVSSKLIDAAYPNYKQVIPSHSEERIVIEREGLLNALRRVSLVSSDRITAAKLVFAKNRLTVTMASPDVGEARETVPVKYSGKEIAVAFNPEYMMDPLKNLVNDEVFMELTDDLSPGVIKCDTPFLYVLMPMRIT